MHWNILHIIRNSSALVNVTCLSTGSFDSLPVKGCVDSVECPARTLPEGARMFVAPKTPIGTAEGILTSGTTAK